MFVKDQTRFAGPVVLCLMASALPQTASATEGYFALGYGPAQRGVAGAGVGYSQDAPCPARSTRRVSPLWAGK